MLRWISPLALVAALLAGVPAPAAGQATSGPGTGTQDLPLVVAPKPSKPYLLIVPIVYYTPETRLAFGAGGSFNLTLGKADTKTRPTSVSFGLTYTLNKQMLLVVKPEIYLPGNSFVITGTIHLEHMPQKFYGIGRDTPDAAVESYTPNTFGVQLGVKKLLSHHLFVGVQGDFDRTTIDKVAPGGAIDRGAVPGGGGGSTVGIGASLSYDTRDNVMFPRRGQYLQVSFDQYAHFLGSDFSFSSVKVDLREYVPVGSASVFAVQGILRSKGAEAPFYMQPTLGGETNMRGYYKGRYRDGTMVAVQAEYRAHLWKKLGVVVFGGLGEVCPSLGMCDIRSVLPSFGAGIRFKLDKRGGTNLRADYAWGRKSTGFYVTVQEAF